MSQFRKVHRVLAFLCFLASFAVYYNTCYPAVSFGESGALAAAAVLQQVPAAPGAPLWVTVAGAFAGLVPGEPAYVLTLFSALCASLTATLVYLTAVMLAGLAVGKVREEELDPSGKTVSRDGVFALVSGVIAALSFAWFDAQWSNATQITTRSAGTLIAALVLWSVLGWYRGDREGEPGSVRRLLLASYIAGLALGTSHPVLDMIPCILLFVWMRRMVPDGPQEAEGGYTLGGLLAAAGLLLLRYGLGIYSPSAFLPLLLLGIAAAGVAALFPKTREGGMSVAFLLLFLLLGYSTYTQVVLRSQAHPPLNMAVAASGSDGSIFSYGHTSPFAAGEHADGSLRNRVGYHYTRYLLWNTVGRAGDHPDAPAAWFAVSDETRREYSAPAAGGDVFPVYFYALPLLLALVGLVLHFRADWRTGIPLLALFVGLGPLGAAIWWFGAATGGGFVASSLLPVALWIGLGAFVLARAAREWRARQGEDEAAAAGAENLANGLLFLCFFLAPANLLYNGWAAHDHYHNRLAHDFARNLLQSCDSGAILFTEDSRPLRYVQDVEGFRRDVRTVDLRLADEEWYRAQLQNESVWDAPAVPAGIAEGIDMGELQGKRMQKGGFAPYLSDSAEVVPLRYTKADGTVDTVRWEWRGLPDNTGKIRYTLPLRLVRQITEANLGGRPVCFAMNVRPVMWGGLEEFFVWEGLVFRVAPGNGLQGVDGYAEFPIDEKRMTALLAERFAFNIPDGDRTAFTAAERKVIPLYRRAFIGLAADELKNRQDPRRCADILQVMDRLLPPSLFPLPYWNAAATASLADEAGARKLAEAYALHAIDGIKRTGDGWRDDPIARRYNPYQTTARMYVLLGEYDRAIEAYKGAERAWSSDPVVRGLVEELRVERHLAAGDSVAAAAELRKIIGEYGSPDDPAMLNNLEAWKEMLKEME